MPISTKTRTRFAGRVVDSQGRGVYGLDLKLRHPVSGVERRVRSDLEGRFGLAVFGGQWTLSSDEHSLVWAAARLGTGPLYLPKATLSVEDGVDLEKTFVLAQRP
ncbi:MAG: hypothetical protein JKY65_31495 [Planctomycetes bacterium]|nr:hypothetical protein [Planctomycetota bacterium]